MLSETDVAALGVTLKLASVTTVVLLALGTPLAWWLARSNWRGKPLIEALVALPLVLPPTVIGFYLLLLLGAGGPVGGLMERWGVGPLVFTFGGLVVGSVVYSLPFVVQPLRDAFAAVGRLPMEAAATLRAGPWDRFWSVAVPLARPGFLTASVLGFAHTVGEFGVVLMIGGSIPGETRVASVAVYDHVEGLEYGAAHGLSGVLVGASFLMLVGVYFVNRRARVVAS